MTNPDNSPPPAKEDWQGFRELDTSWGAVRDGPAEEDRVRFGVEAVEEGCEAE